MAANTSPIFLLTPKQWYGSTGLNANTAFDGTGSNVSLIMTAGSEGSKIETVYFTHLGTNVATVVRLFLNNGGSVGTAANNALIYEQTMAANTASQTAASVQNIWLANLVMPANYRLYVSIGTAIASGIMVACVGGDY